MTILLEAFINGFQFVIGKMIQLLSFIFPTSSGFPTEALTSITTILASTTSFNFIIPMDTLWDILRAVMAFEIGLFTTRLALYIFRSSSKTIGFK